MLTARREFIGALGALGAGLASAQQPQGKSAFLKEAERKPAPPVPVRKGKITKLFKSPEGYPNAMAVAPEGWWIGEQKTLLVRLVPAGAGPPPPEPTRPRGPNIQEATGQTGGARN